MPPFTTRTIAATTLVLSLTGSLPQEAQSQEAQSQAQSQEAGASERATTKRIYFNTLKKIDDPQPLLADYPEFFEPIIEQAHFEAPAIVDDPEADLDVRAWRFSYNVRGIVEMPNHLRASETAVIMVHPWGIDDDHGWVTPEPAGVADFCTKEKNHLAGRHTREIVRPLINSLRGKVKFVMYSLPGSEDPIRRKLYRSYTHTPDEKDRKQGAFELRKKLSEFDYRGQPVTAELALSDQTPVVDYFRQFPGLDAGAKYNNSGFWDLPIPVTTSVDVDPEDVVIYDNDGYEPLRKFLVENGVRHVLFDRVCDRHVFLPYDGRATKTFLATSTSFSLATLLWQRFQQTRRRDLRSTPRFHLRH